jgi:UDP-N-acetylmuramoylalanine--D-glutamate ligase
VAALLNLTPDHLDRHGTFARYREAKARILANQTGEDWAILNADDADVAALAARARGRVVWFSMRRALVEGVSLRGDGIVARLDGDEQLVCRRAEIPLRGQHNVENVLAATACALWAGLPVAEIRASIAGFAGVTHRIERVLEAGGVTYVNDSKGTNVASTIRALESFDEPVILIAGGKGKGQDFAPLAAAARGRVRHAVLIGEDGGTIGAALEAAGISTEAAATMAGAVAAAAAAARPGDVVLLSPACASFDMFDNFEHRGDVFKAAVRELVADGRR